jgi:hypothetical protein
MEPRLADRAREAAKAGRAFLLRRTRRVRWHDLRRLEPIDRRFGMSRGTPVDRFYIERFLALHQANVHGHVLEVGDARYTSMFGEGRVTQSSVLHAEGGNPKAGIVGDLTKGLPGHEQSFDCLILTQVLPFMFDISAAASTIRGLCRDGATALVTVPGISQVSRYDMDRWGDYWRFTALSARKLFADVFGDENVDVVEYGNVLAAVALLHGIAAEELTEEELSSFDPDYPVVIGVVARAAP